MRNCEICGKLTACRRTCSRYCSAILASRTPHGGRKRIPIELRFWDKVNKNGPISEHRKELGACWIWTGTKLAKRYGQIGGGGLGNPRYAHHVSYELTYGPYPKELCVLHKCDNPICVRPEHLFLGTRKDNMRDMVIKGRDRWGAARKRHITA